MAKAKKAKAVKDPSRMCDSELLGYLQTYCPKDSRINQLKKKK